MSSSSWLFDPRRWGATPIRTSNADLESHVAERTGQLVAANMQLTEALAQRTIAQEALARKEEEFRASFEASTVGKAQFDPNTGCIIRANRAFAQMLGYAPDDLVGRIGWEFTWPEDRASERAEYARVLAGETGAYVREARYLGKDGAPIWARISATVVRFPGSTKPNLTVAVIEDIDERHKAQEALEAAKLHLERVVEERTAALEQRALLLREVYHRVKNNLQMIDNFLVMQAQQLSDPKAEDAFRSLRSRVFALGLVHNQLMGSDNLRTFDVAPFLRELSRNIVEGASGGNISISVRAIPLDVGLDFAIPLGLLVTELVTNSLKHAFPGGKGNIVVTLDRLEDGGITLVVSDDGKGYGNAAESGEHKEGLGMNIIKGLVAQLKATFTVQNANGTRSEIRVAAPTLT